MLFQLSFVVLEWRHNCELFYTEKAFFRLDRSSGFGCFPKGNIYLLAVLVFSIIYSPSFVTWRQCALVPQ